MAPVNPNVLKNSRSFWSGVFLHASYGSVSSSIPYFSASFRQRLYRKKCTVFRRREIKLTGANKITFVFVAQLDRALARFLLSGQKSVYLLVALIQKRTCQSKSFFNYNRIHQKPFIFIAFPAQRVRRGRLHHGRPVFRGYQTHTHQGQYGRNYAVPHAGRAVAQANS